MAEEDGSMSVASAPISQVVSVVPTSFLEWLDQGTMEYKNIRAVYAFTATYRESINELLRKITASQEGEYIYLIICLETRGGHLAPHILPLHRLGVRTRIPSKEYDVPIYVRALYTPSRQAPLNLQVEPV